MLKFKINTQQVINFNICNIDTLKIPVLNL